MLIAVSTNTEIDLISHYLFWTQVEALCSKVVEIRGGPSRFAENTSCCSCSSNCVLCFQHIQDRMKIGNWFSTSVAFQVRFDACTLAARRNFQNDVSTSLQASPKEAQFNMATEAGSETGGATCVLALKSYGENLKVHGVYMRFRLMLPCARNANSSLLKLLLASGKYVCSAMNMGRPYEYFVTSTAFCWSTKRKHLISGNLMAHEVFRLSSRGHKGPVQEKTTGSIRSRKKNPSQWVPNSPGQNSFSGTGSRSLGTKT